MKRGQSRDCAPAECKKNEYYRTNIFGVCDKTSYMQPLKPTHHDNSGKVTSVVGSKSLQRVHQAHLRTSTVPEEFYTTAEDTNKWDVVDLKLTGLPGEADDHYLRHLCQGSRLQMVASHIDTNPLSHQCKGLATVRFRHNPKRGSVVDLVSKLGNKNIRAEVIFSTDMLEGGKALDLSAAPGAHAAK